MRHFAILWGINIWHFFHWNTEFLKTDFRYKQVQLLQVSRFNLKRWEHWLVQFNHLFIKFIITLGCSTHSPILNPKKKRGSWGHSPGIEWGPKPAGEKTCFSFLLKLQGPQVFSLILRGVIYNKYLSMWHSKLFNIQIFMYTTLHIYLKTIRLLAFKKVLQMICMDLIYYTNFLKCDNV